MLRRDALMFAVALPLLAACAPAPPGAAAFHAVDITGAEYGRGFTLPDLEGRPRTLPDFQGRVVVLFFGFTHCPDVCPTLLAELAAIKQQLGPDGARLQTVFVTVDPERDTPELLKAYMANFDPSFIALRGTPEQTLEVAKSFKAFVQKVPGKAPGSYSVDHTAGAYVFDPAGKLRLFVRYGQPIDAWVSDLRQLLD